MYCILVAGMPASGKSRFAKWLSTRRALPMMSKDSIKERLFDTVGFANRAEKVKLGQAAELVLLDFARTQLDAGRPFIVENNFESVNEPAWRELLTREGCKPITVRFDGDPAAIYARFAARERSPERHRGHVVNTCYPEITPTPCTPPALDAFCAGIEARGFRRFAIGQLIQVDSTILSQIDYEAIDREISVAIG